MKTDYMCTGLSHLLTAAAVDVPTGMARYDEGLVGNLGLGNLSFYYCSCKFEFMFFE